MNMSMSKNVQLSLNCKYCFPFTLVKMQFAIHADFPGMKKLGSVVQSIVSLTSSLRGHFVKCFGTL